MEHRRNRDRRVERTRTQLHAALGELLHEKPYDAIGVHDIVERAAVGRSTFYTHFRDKDALLVSGIHAILDAAPTDDLLGFSRALFEHIGHHRGAGAHGMAARDQALVHDQLRRVIAARLRRDLAATRRADLAPRLVVPFVASTFVVVLDWWVSTRSPLTAAEVDAVFRDLAEPALRRR